MKKLSIITILLTVLMSMVRTNAYARNAYDISVVNSDGVTIYYKWIKNNTELSVSCWYIDYVMNWQTYSEETKYISNYTGNIVIPASVEYEGKTYSVTSIGGQAFNHCSGLTSITIPNSVTSIEFRAFDGCSGLTSVTIPNSVTSIGEFAFSGTGWYNNQPDGLVYAGKVAYNYKGTMPNNTSIIINDGTVGIADGAFYNCSGLTSVTIPNSVTSIGSRAFSGTGWFNNQPDGLIYAGKVAYYYKGTMPNNTSIIINDGTVGIADFAFQNRSGLTSVTIPNSVTSIGRGAFYYCSGLTSVTISNSMTSIGSEAFRGCSGLIDVYCNAENVPLTNVDAFDFSNISNATLHVPNASIDLYKAGEPWKNFKEIVGLSPKCATPTIIIVGGEVTFRCETENVTFKRNFIINSEGDGDKVILAGETNCHVTIYATKDGYLNSDVAEMDVELYVGKRGDVDGDGNVNVADHVKLSEIIMNQDNMVGE